MSEPFDVYSDAITVRICVVPARHSWDDNWCLSQDLRAEIRSFSKDVLATTYLAVQEYGIGGSLESAIYDLLTSLIDYYQSLEARQERLGPVELEDQQKLRHLLRHIPAG